MDEQISLPDFLTKAITDVLRCFYNNLWMSHFTNINGGDTNWENHFVKKEMEEFQEHSNNLIKILEYVLYGGGCTKKNLLKILDATNDKQWLVTFLKNAEIRGYTREDLKMCDFEKLTPQRNWVKEDNPEQVQIKLIELLDDTLDKVHEVHIMLMRQVTFWQKWESRFSHGSKEQDTKKNKEQATKTDLHALLAELKLSVKYNRSATDNTGDSAKWLNPYYEMKKKERENKNKNRIPDWIAEQHAEEERARQKQKVQQKQREKALKRALKIIDTSPGYEQNNRIKPKNEP